jgi:hypothetical protein
VLGRIAGAFRAGDVGGREVGDVDGADGVELGGLDAEVEDGMVIAEPQGRPLAFWVRQATAALRRSVTSRRASWGEDWLIVALTRSRK